MKDPRRTALACEHTTNQLSMAMSALTQVSSNLIPRSPWFPLGNLSVLLSSHFEHILHDCNSLRPVLAIWGHDAYVTLSTLGIIQFLAGI
jgi:hypothetical protein